MTKNKKVRNKREIHVGGKDFSFLIVLGSIADEVISIRKEMYELKDSKGKSLNNMVAGHLVVLMSFFDSVPHMVDCKLSRGEVVAWKNMYIEILDQMKPNKNQTKADIEKERQWFVEEIDQLIRGLEDGPFYDENGDGIENPYGEYSIEKV
jgi:hypothetical protein